MIRENNYLNYFNFNPLFRDMYDYLLDSGQRSILFMDILRKRGNNYFQTIKKGEPPVLIFDYEIICSGLKFKRPVNYDLAVIIPPKNNIINPNSRPIIVIDPPRIRGEPLRRP